MLEPLPQELCIWRLSKQSTIGSCPFELVVVLAVVV